MWIASVSSALKKYNVQRDVLRGFWHGHGSQDGFPEERMLQLRSQTWVEIREGIVKVEGEEQEILPRVKYICKGPGAEEIPVLSGEQRPKGWVVSWSWSTGGQWNSLNKGEDMIWTWKILSWWCFLFTAGSKLGKKGPGANWQVNSSCQSSVSRLSRVSLNSMIDYFHLV